MLKNLIYTKESFDPKKIFKSQKSFNLVLYFLE